MFSSPVHSLKLTLKSFHSLSSYLYATCSVYHEAAEVYSITCVAQPVFVWVDDKAVVSKELFAALS